MEKHNQDLKHIVNKSTTRPAIKLNKAKKYDENTHYKFRFTLRDIESNTDIEKLYSWKRDLMKDRTGLELKKDLSQKVNSLYNLNVMFLSAINKRLIELTRQVTDLKHINIGGDMKIKATILGQIKKVSKEQNLSKFILQNMLNILNRDSGCSDEVIQKMYEESEELAIKQFNDYIESNSVDLIEKFDPDIAKIVEYINTEVKKLSLTESVELV